VTPILGRDAICDYWQTKVVEGQGNIRCELLNLYLDGNTAIAEWETEFDDGRSTGPQSRSGRTLHELALATEEPADPQRLVSRFSHSSSS
jgi:hypothetical protein